MFSTIARVAAIGCLIALVQTAPAAAPGPQYVRVKLLDFSFTGNCDPFGISKCDLLFDVDYIWNQKTEPAEYGPYSGSNTAHLDFGKEPPKVLDGPFAVGSKVTVNVVAYDADFLSNDQLGEFSFEFTVPEAEQLDTIAALQDGLAHMSIEFRAIF